MLVYANHLTLEGAGAEPAAMKALGAWLKEQLGFGLHPDQLCRDGEYRGQGGKRASLRIHSCYDGEPALCSWVLRHADAVYGRQWIVEVGTRRWKGGLEASCVVKTDELSTLVASPVAASQPRFIRYIISNVSGATDASLAGHVPGETLKTIGEDLDSYRAFRAEVEWRERPGAIVLVSPDRDGGYLVDPVRLQSTLVGLAQVVQIVPGANTFEMSEVLGKQWSAWGGSINVLSIPTAAGTVRYQYFLPEQVREWGNPNHRISQVLAWVTAGTNLPRLRKHIRPEGVIQLATVRRLQQTRDRSAHMDVAQLRQELVEVTRQAEENNDFFNELVEVNAKLEESNDLLKLKLAEANDDIRAKEYQAQVLRDQLQRAGSRPSVTKSEELLHWITRKDEPTPFDCLSLIEQCHGDACIVLDTAKESAQRADGFLYGRDLLDLLLRLVTTYRNALMDGGDSKARSIFGKKEFAAKESETVMGNKAMRRQRTFEYEGEQVEMFRHLKIGVADDCSKTIRVHFHWDSARQLIVIGYCGAHLSVTSH